MIYMLLALVFYACAVIGHVLFCRNSKKPGLYAKAFVRGALLWLSAYAVIVAILPARGIGDPGALIGLPLKVTAGFIFVLLIPVYLCFYVLTVLVSPSKKILEIIAKEGQLNKEQICQYIDKEAFIDTRLTDLIESRCVMNDNGRFTLSKEGKKIAWFLDLMQGVLGRKLGG